MAWDNRLVGSDPFHVEAWASQVMSAAPSTTDWIVATATVVGVVVALVTYVVSTVVNRRDRREQSRPMMAAELRKHEWSDTMMLVVQNLGQSIAHDVSVTFDPPLTDTGRAESGIPFLVRRYSRSIPRFVPGIVFSNTYYIGGVGSGGEEDVPDQITVIISYSGPDGHDYEDKFPLDTFFLRQGTEVRSTRDPAVIARNTQKAVERIAAAANELVKVADYSTAGQERRGVLDRRIAEAERRRRDAAAGMAAQMSLSEGKALADPESK